MSSGIAWCTEACEPNEGRAVGEPIPPSTRRRPATPRLILVLRLPELWLMGRALAFGAAAPIYRELDAEWAPGPRSWFRVAS